MSVIFKEKKYDQLILLLKNLTIIILILLILISIFNYIIENRVELFKKRLKTRKSEELKYKSLIEQLNSDKNMQKVKKDNYNLLITLANYAENINYNSLKIKNNKVNLNAVSSQHSSIFKFIDDLKKDSQFKNVKLININQRNNYYFQLEAICFQ